MNLCINWTPDANFNLLSVLRTFHFYYRYLTRDTATIFNYKMTMIQDCLWSPVVAAQPDKVLD